MSNVSDALTMARQVVGHLQAAGSTASLIDVAKPAQVQPLLLIDADTMHWEGLPEAVQTMHSLFSGFYMQAVNIIGNVSKVKALQKLAPLNPDREPGYSEMIRAGMGLEGYTHRLPHTGVSLKSLGLEDLADEIEDRVIDKINEDMDAQGSVGAGGDKKANEIITEASNLCVGKLFDVTMSVNVGEGKDARREEAVIKVAVRLLAQYMSTQNVVSILGHNDVSDTDLKERFYKWRSGRITIRDLVFCNDLIEKERNLAIKDSSGMVQQMNTRRQNHAEAGLITGVPSLAVATNLVIVSKETLELIEAKVGANLKSVRGRKAIFDETGLMILMVVNKGYDTVQIYFRGVDMPTTASLRDMKSSNKSGGPDVVDLIKAFVTGNNPTL